MGGLNVGYLGLAPKSWNKKAKGFFEGSPEEHEQVSTLLPNQEGLQQEQVDAAKGNFGAASDYHKNMLSDDPADINAFNAPHLRQFNEEIIPGISEQFAGMGAGGLSSSGFRNAAVTAGTDLSERLGAIRANLRQNSANALQNAGQSALNKYSEDRVTQQGTEGALPGLVSAAAPIVATAIGGPAAGAATYAATNMFNRTGNQVGNKSQPYQSNNISASPKFSRTSNAGY